MLLRRTLCLLFLVGALAGTAGAVSESLPDTDHDGLSDALEQALLTRFLPAFQLESTDCAAIPARFLAGSATPAVAAQDGTIYGQAVPRAGNPSGAIELHFYHLWSTDCGPHGHPLDAEHVSALLFAMPGRSYDDPASWRAAFWYAAAHENTVCDVSQITRAGTLDATDHGATVWISPGKHASFFARALCGGGCGGDRCRQSTALHVPEVINLGELQAPMNGIAWLTSPRWPLAGKMARSDFSAGTLSRLDALPANDIVWVRPGKHPAQQTIAVSGATAEALARSADNTGAALDRSGTNTNVALTLAGSSTGGALRNSYRGTRGALQRSAKGVGRFLHLDGKEKTAEPAPH